MRNIAPITIREARPDEHEAARALTLAAYAPLANVMTPPAWAGLANALQSALATTSPHEQLVAVQGDMLVGSVRLFPASTGDPDGSGGRMIWPELRLLAVAPAARSQGVGTALVRACIERARAAGAPALGLYTSASMRSAIALYERLGFTRVPAYDFQPPGAELITAYRFALC